MSDQGSADELREHYKTVKGDVGEGVQVCPDCNGEGMRLPKKPNHAGWKIRCPNCRGRGVRRVSAKVVIHPDDSPF
jgi:DnaJ-class molecular chaperone